MPSVCMYFQVHQPIRLKQYNFFDIGKGKKYFDDDRNRFYLERVSRKCYLPTNNKLLELIHRHDGKFKISFSITGVLLDQLEKDFPNVLESFIKLVDTGCVEMFNETYYHSLAYLISKEEFIDQARLHQKRIKSIFGIKPSIFRNTEAMYSNEIARDVRDMGYKGIVAEGLSHILQWRSPNHLYTPKGSDIRVFLRNYKLSDDVGFRFSEKSWKDWPLTADKYASWLSASDGDIVNIFMDYETFGEHQWDSTGIMEFLHHLPNEVLAYENLDFKTPSEIIGSVRPVGEYDVPYISSWADVNRDLSAWLENSMQQHAFNEVKAMESLVKKSRDPELISNWRRLLTSDHFYYICTKWFADGDVHKYFNCYETPYDAFINYMNILADLRKSLSKRRVKNDR